MKFLGVDELYAVPAGRDRTRGDVRNPGLVMVVYRARLAAAGFVGRRHLPFLAAATFVAETSIVFVTAG